METPIHEKHGLRNVYNRFREIEEMQKIWPKTDKIDIERTEITRGSQKTHVPVVVISLSKGVSFKT